MKHLMTIAFMATMMVPSASHASWGKFKGFFHDLGDWKCMKHGEFEYKAKNCNTTIKF